LLHCTSDIARAILLSTSEGKGFKALAVLKGKYSTVSSTTRSATLRKLMNTVLDNQDTDV
jgi:hypothetical protein